MHAVNEWTLMIRTWVQMYVGSVVSILNGFLEHLQVD